MIHLKKIIINIFKLIGIMYISIGLKNILQIILGTIIDYQEIAEPYGLINLLKEPSFKGKINLIILMIGYDIIIFSPLFYLDSFYYLSSDHIKR